MSTTSSEFPENLETRFQAAPTNVSLSAVSWSAILAGAAAAAALSLILLLLGTGLGMTAISPWANEGLNAATIGFGAILWISLTQIIASGMGGYLTGRLRTKWVSVHSDEVYFRDTAHGFLSWAVASLISAVLLTSVIGSIVGGGIQAGASLAGSATAATVIGVGSAEGDSTNSENENGPMGYLVDTLFRKDSSLSATATSSANDDSSSNTDSTKDIAEITNIFVNGGQDDLSKNDIQYAGQLVAQHTGLSQEDAEKRVNDTYNQIQTTLKKAEVVAKESAEKARKASAYAALWLFISLLIGAFTASLAGTFGGRARDA